MSKNETPIKECMEKGLISVVVVLVTVLVIFTSGEDRVTAESVLSLLEPAADLRTFVRQPVTLVAVCSNSGVKGSSGSSRVEIIICAVLSVNCIVNSWGE